MRSRRGKIAALGLGPRSHPDRFDPKSFLNATALMCAIALPLQVSPSSTPRKQSTPCSPAASATSTRCAAASTPGRSTSPSLSPRPRPRAATFSNPQPAAPPSRHHPGHMVPLVWSPYSGPYSPQRDLLQPVFCAQMVLLLSERTKVMGPL